jgi:hypothetical protein
MGGAGAAPVDVEQGGFRSLLAFWLGGAGYPAFVPQPPEPDTGSAGRGGGGGAWPRREGRRGGTSGSIVIDFAARAEKRNRHEEDEIMLQLIIQAVTKGLL